MFPDDVVNAGKEALEKNGVEHEIKTYAGVPHGKCHRIMFYCPVI